jgi:hypothetical protein
MTREQQVRALLELLAPPAGYKYRRRDAPTARHIKVVLSMAESMSRTATTHKVFGSKKGKAQLQRYYDALLLLQSARDDDGSVSCEVQAAYSALHPAIRPWFSLAKTAHIAGTETVITKNVINREIKKAKRLLKPSPSPRRGDGLKRKAAVAAAHYLLVHFGHKASTTRGGKWERSAAIILGKKGGLQRHVREFCEGRPVLQDYPGLQRRLWRR